MIIDDDADDKFFFKEATERMFIFSVCLEANDGADAVNKLRKVEQLPDIIFLDMNMPRIDGRECLKELKRESRLKSIPVIMYSTSFTDRTIAELQALGPSDYLTKPTDTNKLPAQIYEVVRKHINLS
jgi:CheY-like chemotaxis protein